MQRWSSGGNCGDTTDVATTAAGATPFTIPGPHHGAAGHVARDVMLTDWVTLRISSVGLGSRPYSAMRATTRLTSPISAITLDGQVAVVASTTSAHRLLQSHASQKSCVAEVMRRRSHASQKSCVAEVMRRGSHASRKSCVTEVMRHGSHASQKSCVTEGHTIFANVIAVIHGSRCHATCRFCPRALAPIGRMRRSLWIDVSTGIAATIASPPLPLHQTPLLLHHCRFTRHRCFELPRVPESPRRPSQNDSVSLL
eukprot:gene9213-biopygen4845